MRGTRRYVISLVLVALLVAGIAGATFLFNLRPRLGLDLRGGLSVILTAPDGTRSDVLEKTLEILRARVDRAGVAEPEISREGSTNILIQLPGSGDPQRLLQLIGRTAQLQFRQVMMEIPQGDPNFEALAVSEDDSPDTEAVLVSKDGLTKYQLTPAALTGEVVRSGSAVVDPQSGRWHVELRFDRSGSSRWEQFTGELACLEGVQRQVAIVLDGLVESAPRIDPEVECNKGIGGGETVITGDFTQQEAKDLALVLTTGALPIELEQSQVTSVSPTLGRESLRAGLVAGALGLALTMIFVLIYYRSLGLQTWLGLFLFASMVYGLIVLLGVAIGWSLTLAGIAGLIVSIGVATDSYIVFYERVKEEVHEGRTLRSSMDRGFTHAWRTLRTANGVTILAAVILYLLAVGPVRGFALAMGMATALDLVIFVLFTWPLASILSRSKLFSEGRFIGMRRALEGRPDQRGKISLLQKIYRSEFSIDFIGRRRVWLIVSGALVGISALALLPGIRGMRVGIDFTGGTLFRVPAEREVTAAEVKDVMTDLDHPESVVQVLRDPTTDRIQIQIQTEAIEDPEERASLVEGLGQFAGDESVDIEAVGEKWGRQVTTKAARGLAVFLVLVLLYMSWRLEPKMAISGVAALLHDVVITAGIYAIVGFDVTPATVVAILTILGYSLYDTVVVFDKIRENVSIPANARKSFKQIANDSMNQVLMRSINTSLVTLLPVGSLLFVGSLLLGADTLRDLALALFVGLAASTYSSIFVATPLLSLWKERERRYAGVKERTLAEVGARRGPSSDLELEEDPARRTSVDREPVAPNELDEDEDEDEEAAYSPVGPAQRETRQSPRAQRRRQTRRQRKRRRR